MSDSGKRLPQPQRPGFMNGKFPVPRTQEPPASVQGAATRTDEAPPVPGSGAGSGSADRYAATVTSEAPTSPPSDTVTDDGRYQVLQLIARGGMGEVWLAKDDRLTGRFVALKRLTQESRAVPKLRERFRSEAESMAKLVHMHTIRVFDIGSDDAGPFICMEYVSGPDRQVADWPADFPAPALTLQEYVDAEGPQSVSAAIHLIRKLCLAVAEAHRLGIIHRDIKPANVLLDAGLEPKLIDFGLARDLRPEESQHTVAGAQMLTIGYGAPEQETDASQADERADVYALGAVLWFLVSGQNPRFYRDGDAPDEVSAVLAAALTRDRDTRIQSVMDLDAALVGIQGEQPVGKLAMMNTSGVAGTQLAELSVCLDGDRKAGACPFCNHQHEPIPASPKKRKFCAGCGTSLWLKCHRCTGSVRRVPEIPLWDRHCSKCGEDLLSPVINLIESVVQSIGEARNMISTDTDRANELAVSATESLAALTRDCGADFSAGKVGSLCNEVLQEIESLRNDATGLAAENDEDAWSAALQLNTEGAFKDYLKRFATHAEEAELCLERLLLDAGIRHRLKTKSWMGLLPDIEHLISLDPATKQRWSDEKLARLLKPDHSVAACVSYLNLSPQGKAAARAMAIVSPKLRQELILHMSDRELRRRYLTYRLNDQLEEDESRAFSATLWLWSLLGALIAVPMAVAHFTSESELLVPAIVVAGASFMCGLLFATLSGARAKLGPLPVLSYLGLVSRKFRPADVQFPRTPPEVSNTATTTATPPSD